MIPTVVFDLETIPTTNVDEIARIEAAAHAHNASLKKPHPPEEVLRIIDENVRKTSLDAALGSIVVIAAVVDGGPVRHWSRDFKDAGSEAPMLRQMLVELSEEVSATCGEGLARLVGHNSVGFDRPFLRQRGIVNGVRFPGWMTKPVKPWDATGLDTMLMWTGGLPHKYVELGRLARALGLGDKDGLEGDKVWDAIKAGDLDTVVKHCVADVELTRAVFNRMMLPDAEG